MKLRHILMLSGACLLPQLAMADTGASQQVLGIVHAILDYCKQVDPRDASRFQAIWRKVEAGVPDKDDERQIYELIMSRAGATSDPAGAKACTALLSLSSKDE